MAPFANYLSALVQRRDLVYKITTGVYGFPISKENGYLSITKNMKYAIVQQYKHSYVDNTYGWPEGPALIPCD